MLWVVQVRMQRACERVGQTSISRLAGSVDDIGVLWAWLLEQEFSNLSELADAGNLASLEGLCDSTR